MGQPFRYFLFDNRIRKFIEIRNGTVCGRSEGEIKFSGDDLVSKRHLCFTVVKNEVYVEDLGATNRTRVNSVSIVARKQRRLRLNDVIEFGCQRLILTNQDRYPPQNTQDLDKTVRIYKGLWSDGVLSACRAGSITHRTKTILDLGTFRRLQMKRATDPIRVHAGVLAMLSLGAVALAAVMLAGFWSLKHLQF